MRVRMVMAATVLMLAACGGPKPQTYSNADWNFAVDIAGTTKVTPTPAKGDAPAGLLVTSTADGDDFAINVVDARGATATTDQMITGASKALASGMDTDIGASSGATTGGVAGQEVRLDKDGKPVMLARVFVAGGLLYEVSVTTPKGAIDAPGKAFFASFRLLQAPPPVPAAPANAVAANTATTNTAAANTADANATGNTAPAQ